jgi:predicted acyltransferase
MRYLSLDFFRGLTIALMIVVNTPGTWEHVYAPLRHAKWHGCTPTDLVFPFFLFIVGVASWFSFSKLGDQPASVLAKKIVRRTVLIFLIGLALNAYPFFNADWSTLRIMGVLQRIALAYGAGAFLCVFLPRQRLPFVAAAILTGYWLAMWLGATGDPYALETNLARRIDLALLTAPHLYKGFGIPFDPEGLFSTLPAAVTVMAGYWTGSIINAKGDDRAGLVLELFRFGVIAGVAGLLFDLIFPINKPLWTSSYVLYTAGLALIFLAFCIWALDIRGWQAPARPFLVFGANPLFAYVLAGVLVKTLLQIKYADASGEARSLFSLIYKNVFYPINNAEFGSLLFALCYATLIWSVCWVLWKKKIFIKI